MNILRGIYLVFALFLLLFPSQTFGIEAYQPGYGQRDEFPEEVLLIIGGGAAAAAGLKAVTNRKSKKASATKRKSPPKVRAASGRVLADLARATPRATYTPQQIRETIDTTATSEENWEEIGVSAAAPKRVLVNEPFPVVVALHNPKQQTELPVGDDRTEVVQKTGWIYRDPKSPIIFYLVTIKATKCLVLDRKEHYFRLDINHHSHECRFTLKPLDEGKITITVTAEQVDSTYRSDRRPGEHIRETTLVLEARLDANTKLDIDDIQAELQNNDRYSLSALRLICDEMKIDWENLPGETRMEKARELFLYCQRRGQLVELAHAMDNV